MAVNRYSEFLDTNTEQSLFQKTIMELQRQLTPKDLQKLERERERTPDRLKLSTFVETTSKLALEPWQLHMCERLEKLTYQKGQRILLHKPPQHGGSVIVSQRLPAYLVGDNPETRVKLACYNIDHATRFTSINRAIMTSQEYRGLFKNNRELYVPTRSSDSEFSTRAREAAQDGQSSLMALGLQTGFVGQGADHLIIDDPYASPNAAASPAIRAATWVFWVGNAALRITEETNVVVMFHRYGEEDFAGELIANEGLQQNGGRWELISYRAEWDGDERIEVGGPDPIGRKVGDYLSPRLAAQPIYYREKKRNPQVWQSQFQGKPSNAEGGFFLVNKIEVVTKLDTKLKAVCRSWDIASSVDGDWTVGVLMGLGTNKLIYILDVVRIRKNTAERNKIMRRTAIADRRKYPNIQITVPQDPSASGKDNIFAFQQLFIGFEITGKSTKGDKEKRADPYSDYVNAGMVRIVYSGEYGLDDEGNSISWVIPYKEELRTFPNSTKKDQVDASSDAFSELALTEDLETGIDFDTMGLDQSTFDAAQNLLIDDDYDDQEAMMLEVMTGQIVERNEMDDYGTTNYQNEGVIIHGKIYYPEKKIENINSRENGTTPRQRRKTDNAIKVKIRRRDNTRANQY